MRSNKIILFGYWENNLGDDLFLKLFAENFSQNIVYILTKKKYKDIYKYKNVKVIYSDSLRYRFFTRILRYINYPEYYYFRYIRGAAAVVLLGGSLFMETGNWRRQIHNLNYLVDNCTNTYVAGSNFGPYESKEFLNGYKQLFSKMKKVCFRDRFSLDLFKDLSNVYYAPDAVLSLDFTSQTNFDNNEYGDYCIVSIIDLKNRSKLNFYKEEYENKIIDVATELFNKGLNIVLMSFCEKEGDLEVANSIYLRLTKMGITSFVYNHRVINESLDIIKNSQLIVATRLHSMILAFLFNVPVFPIPYSSKMIRIIDDYGFTKAYSKIEDIANLETEIVVNTLLEKPQINPEILEEAKKHLHQIIV